VVGVEPSGDAAGVFGVAAGSDDAGAVVDVLAPFGAALGCGSDVAASPGWAGEVVGVFFEDEEDPGCEFGVEVVGVGYGGQVERGGCGVALGAFDVGAGLGGAGRDVVAEVGDEPWDLGEGVGTARQVQASQTRVPSMVPRGRQPGQVSGSGQSARWRRAMTQPVRR
jgi:hypothetical protein